MNKFFSRKNLDKKLFNTVSYNNIASTHVKGSLFTCNRQSNNLFLLDWIITRSSWIRNFACILGKSYIFIPFMFPKKYIKMFHKQPFGGIL